MARGVVHVLASMWKLYVLIGLPEVTMKSVIVIIVIAVSLGANKASSEDQSTGGAILLEDIKNNRAGMVEVYRRNFDDAFSKTTSYFSDDFKSLLAECSAELMVQKFEVMTVEEIDSYHAHPEISETQSERVVATCYDWIVTELENAKAGEMPQ